MTGTFSNGRLHLMFRVAGICSGILLTTGTYAADLGGNCCADLEERISELEATTVRKGTNKVSLKLSGTINKALMLWDDGHTSDVYVVDGSVISTKLRLEGDAKIRKDWTTGFKLEWNFVTDAANKVTQSDDDSSDAYTLRHADIWMKGKLGKVSLGKGDAASNGTSEVDLSGTKTANDSTVTNWGAAFSFHQSGSGGTYGTDLEDAYDNLDGQTRLSRIRYDTPDFVGFIASISTGEDDFWDIALRYKKKLKELEFISAIAFSESGDETTSTTERLNGSVSALHIPTGLNLTLGAGDDDTSGSSLDKTFWYGKVGVKRKWMPLGETAISVDYAQANEITEATGDYKHYGIQFVQNIDAAEMELYATWSHNEYDTTSTSYDDIDFFMIGSRIDF